MARTAKAADAMAPTRPRPGITSRAENATAGPVLATMHRMRDVVRDTTQRGG